MEQRQPPETFLVGTGIVFYRIEAHHPYEAIEILKQRIRERASMRKHATISMSLVESLARGDLNFIVFDIPRTRVLAAEINGRFIERPTRAVAEVFPTMIPPALIYQLPFEDEPERRLDYYWHQI